MKTPVLSCCLILLLAVATPALPQARFEVVSIRPSRPDATASDARLNFHGDRMTMTAYTLGDVLDMLNDFQLHRVTDGPPSCAKTMRFDRYDIEAKAGRELAKADIEPAIMAMLADRFQLKSHRETRQMPGIALLAPHMPAGIKKAADDERYARRDDRGDTAFLAIGMSGLTNYLSNMWQTPVADQTGLTGTYDVTIALSKIDAQPGETRGDRVREAVLALGFQLEDKKIPLEITVVDRCDKPTPN